MLGGFILQVVSTWRDRRSNYRDLISQAKSMLITMSATLPIEPIKGVDMAKIRRNFARWTILSIELTVAKARQMNPEAIRHYLEATNLMDKCEWSTLATSTDRDAAIFFWITMELKCLRDVGLLTPVEYTHLLSSVKLMREASHDLMGRVSIELPFSCAAGLHVLLAIRCTKASC